ncbi:MAG: Anaerobic nitric oxide reductase transcription regulator NorR [Ignavibacteriaceae bacterium]|nr:Anaerobic nitric oxide reductase transcription regulator NorR [Ignavibacteriaceae bacterium]
MQADSLQVLHKLALTTPDKSVFNDPTDYLKWYLGQIHPLLDENVQLRFVNIQYFSSENLCSENFLNGRLLNIPTMIDLNNVGENSVSEMLREIAAFLASTSIIQQFHSEANRITINTFGDKLKIETIRDANINVNCCNVNYNEEERLLSITIPDLYSNDNSRRMLGENFFSAENLVFEKFNDERKIFNGSIMDHKLNSLFSSAQLKIIIKEVQKFLNSPEIVSLTDKYIDDFTRISFYRKDNNFTAQIRFFIETALLHSWLKSNIFDYHLVVTRYRESIPIANAVLLINTNARLNTQLLKIFQLSLNIVFNNITHMLEGSDITQKNTLVKQKLRSDTSISNFVYSSSKMKAIDYEITKFARTDESIILLGETGVGKDLIAFEIHKRSNRGDMPFISVPLSSLSEQIIESELFGSVKGAYTGSNENKLGKFEQAEGGTLYLPEISEIPLNIQIKLLEFIQYKNVQKVGGKNSKLNVRLIFASNSNLEDLLRKSLIRSDFYHRIMVLKIVIPPLRDRKEDIPTLVKYFVSRHSMRIVDEEYSFDQDAIEMLKNMVWSGNVRELENFIIRAIVNSRQKLISIDTLDELQEGNLNNDLKTNENFKSKEKEFKRQYFLNLMEETNSSISEVARISGLTRQAVYKILNELDIPH